MVRGRSPPERSPPQIGRAPPDPFSLERPLLQFSPVDPWVVRDACEGVAITGSIGSGKTSGSGSALAKAYLRAGFGGLVLCSKPEERELWEGYTKETGRSDSLIIVSPETPWRFNFLDYELRREGRGGGQTENLVNLLSQITEIVEGKVDQSGDSTFWNRSMRELLRNAVDLLALSKGTITLEMLATLIAEAPHSKEEVGNTEWQKSSFLAQCIGEAHEREKTPSQALDFEATGRYWLNTFPSLSDRTRSGIVATLTGVTDLLAHGYPRDLLATTTNLVPEVTYKDGAIILLDVSVQEYDQMGRVVQGIFKLMFQKAILRRDVTKDPRPVMLWMDEYQNFVGGFDYKVQAVARSARLCTVALTQSISNLYTVLGKGAHDEANALMGNFQTKIFHQQSDVATNQYAADLIAQTWQVTNSWNSSQNPQSPPSASAGGSDSVQYQVLPSVFTTLRKGGPANRLEVEAIIYQGGRRWRRNGKTYLKTVFLQGNRKDRRFGLAAFPDRP